MNIPTEDWLETEISDNTLGCMTPSVMKPSPNGKVSQAGNFQPGTAGIYGPSNSPAFIMTSHH